MEITYITVILIFVRIPILAVSKPGDWDASVIQRPFSDPIWAEPYLNKHG